MCTCTCTHWTPLELRKYVYTHTGFMQGLTPHTHTRWAQPGTQKIHACLHMCTDPQPLSQNLGYTCPHMFLMSRQVEAIGQVTYAIAPAPLHPALQSSEQGIENSLPRPAGHCAWPHSAASSCLIPACTEGRHHPAPTGLRTAHTSDADRPLEVGTRTLLVIPL